MKAWWKVSDKPRGRWNPKFEFGLSISGEEDGEIGVLNVSTTVGVCIIFDASVRVQIPDFARCAKGNFVLPWPECPYSASARAVGAPPMWNSSCCHECWFPNWQYADRGSVKLSEKHFEYRLPWRPGGRPDYSDFIEPTRRFLVNLLEELERRVAEARESSPSDDWGTVEEEFESYSVRQTETVAVAERKLRVIRA